MSEFGGGKCPNLGVVNVLLANDSQSSKNTIGYFRVSFFLSGIPGISGISGYFRVFLGLPIYTRVIF